MSRIVADLGNSRLKWGRVSDDGRLASTVALPVDDPSAWAKAWDDWGLSTAGGWAWSVASVNPPLADRLDGFLADRGAREVRWYRSAREIDVRHDLENPETAGADRALAVVGAQALQSSPGPGLVVSCGTAITVERISNQGVWQGGAIAPGLGPMARALHMLTAQLPEVAPREAPAAFGRSTIPALEAGVFWAIVGTIRELLTRQSEGFSMDHGVDGRVGFAALTHPTINASTETAQESLPWLVWTGGDASIFAPWVEWPGSRVVPDLVLHGLSLA